MGLLKTMFISAAGMRAQSARLRVISENLANAHSTARSPDGQPYRRKTISFKNVFDPELGVATLRVAGYGVDRSDFVKRYDPGHPGADDDGYVQTPNVNPLIEMIDMREALRSYEANLSVIEVAKAMLRRTIDLLRN